MILQPLLGGECAQPYILAVQVQEVDKGSMEAPAKPSELFTRGCENHP